MASSAESHPVARFAVRTAEAPALGFALPGLAGGTAPIAITPDGNGVAAELVARLRALGVPAVEAAVDALPPDAGGVVYLGGLRDADQDAAIAVNREAFEAARAVAARFREHGGLFVTVQDTGGDFGLAGSRPERAWLAGLSALVKTAGHEWPRAAVRAIDIARGTRSAAAIAQALVAELFAGGPEIEVGLAQDGRRVTLASVPTSPAPADGALEEGAVVIATGGARGVTAACLEALARAARPRLLLLGRTALVDEPAHFRGVTEAAELKRIALDAAKRAGRAATPREIGSEVDHLLATREVRRTLAQLQAAGATVRYESLDVRDAAALSSLLDDVRRTWGPIRGLVHGAGVLADAFIDRKTDAQFDAVFATKVLGLQALLAATRDDPLAWLGLFSSVAARGGNAGQADYAMANEILNKVAAAEAQRRQGRCRVVAIGWGPWDGGMVTPGLRAHFEQRGVALLPLAAGADAFVRELRAPAGSDVEVVIAGAAPHLQPPQQETVLARVEIAVGCATHPQLASHRIQGKPVLPMALVLEWFARLARAVSSERDSIQLRDMHVVRGVTLAGFDGAGDRFLLQAIEGGTGATRLELRDAGGARALRYSAVIEAATARAAAQPLHGHDLGASPWGPGDFYTPDTLFHGSDFQVLQSIEGYSERGARATLTGTSEAGWPGEPWETDPAAVDGALQLAILCGLPAIGQTLPLRIGQIGYAGGVPKGPIRCALNVRAQTPERVVCDIALADSEGMPIVDLVDVEMYQVPSGTTSSVLVVA